MTLSWWCDVGICPALVPPTGLCLNGVRSSYDPALTFIQEAMTNRASRDVRIGGIIGSVL